MTHIRDSDIVELDLDLTFAEEEFSSSGASDPRVSFMLVHISKLTNL